MLWTGAGMARINSRQVEAFRAMMLTGSVTEAARLMAVTQPAASRLLRDFQSLLKMELFERRGTGLVPTAAATALYTEVERSFVGLERITVAAEEIRGRRIGSVRIAGLAARPNGFFPRASPRLVADRGAAGALEWLSAAARRALPQTAPQSQPRLLRRDFTDCHR